MLDRVYAHDMILVVHMGTLLLSVYLREVRVHHKTAYQSVGGGIFLIGLGLLFLIPGIPFFPWILAVIGLAGLPTSLAHQRGWYGAQGAFWLIGLAILFATNLLWPGILILIGLSTLVGALSRESAGSPFARETRTQDALSESPRSRQAEGAMDETWEDDASPGEASQGVGPKDDTPEDGEVSTRKLT